MVTGVRQLCISKATSVHVASLFLLQRSLRMITTAAISDASLVRRKPCSFKTISAESAQEPRKKTLHAEGDEGRNAAWIILADAQAVVAAVEQASSHFQSQNQGKGKPHPMGPRRMTLAACLQNALSVINLAKADQQQQTIIARQD